MPNFAQLVEFVSVGRDAASISLPGSPIDVHSGQEWTGRANYGRGIPNATAFDYLFFSSEADGRQAVSEINDGTATRANNGSWSGLTVTPMTTDIPTGVTFNPATPATTGNNLMVDISMTFPEITNPTRYYMVLIIIQE